MHAKFIFLLIFVLFVKDTICLRSYFSNDDQKESDPIEENGKEKRSLESYGDFDISNVKKDLTDYDYKNGNAEPEVDERETDQVKNIKKRELKTFKDIQSYSDADIELAISRLSDNELQTLEKIMENEVESSKVAKRHVIENDVDKQCGSQYGCKTKDSDEFEDENYKQVLTYEQLPDERPKPHRIFKRYNRFSPLSRDEILQARINFLKDNYKRQSEIGKIEHSFKRNERHQRDIEKDVNRNPYFNSLIGPRSRTKRSVDNKLTKMLVVNPMDDPKSDEHIKLLEDSFPNPEDSLYSDQSHVRVKRS